MAPSPSSSRSASPSRPHASELLSPQIAVQGEFNDANVPASSSHKTFSIASYYYSAPLQESPKKRRIQPSDEAVDWSAPSSSRNLRSLAEDQQESSKQTSARWSDGLSFGDEAGPSRIPDVGHDDLLHAGDYLTDGPQPGDSVSFLGTSRQSSFVMGGDVPHTANSEGAFLTEHSAPTGFGKNTPRVLVQSPDGDSYRGQDYFGESRTGNELEDGTLNHQDGQSLPQRSSADMYHRLGISTGDKPVHQARQGLSRMGKSIRRMSRRVINLDQSDRPAVEGRIRLPDNDDQDSDAEDAGIITVQELNYEAAVAGLRGKSIGIFGPDSRLRQSLASLMAEWWIEPLILAMILLNVILLIVQSSRNVFNHPLKPGYFDYWEDYALLSIFVAYTVELFARIMVSGLIINPPSTYQPAQAGDSPGDENVVETPYAQHMRDNTARSNTADVFADLGGTIKARAVEAIRPHNHLGHIRKGGQPISPNRMYAPRLVASDALDPAGTSRSATSDASLNRQQGTIKSALWEDKTSRFLQKSRLAPFAEAIMKQRAQAVDYAFLRHSWNRVDLVAVLAFWTAFILAMLHKEMTPSLHLRIFRALSVLRCARLLTATRGTSVILRSLKTAGPLLINVAFFTVFAMLLFSIIGVQSFEGDYLRTCVVVGDLLAGSIPSLAGQNFTLQQLCGGHIDPVSGQTHSAIRVDGSRVPISAKGFICPTGQYCVETTESPESSTENFDNIFTSLLQVIIVISSNGWSTIMYNMMDADYYASCLYFILGLIIMNFWMANLFVAVITNTFASISAETKQSAFAAERIEPAVKETTQSETIGGQRRRRVANVFKRFWGYTKYFWLALIVADLGVQASQASYHRSAANAALDVAELYLTLAFDVEILLRFLSYLLDNDWRAFFAIKRNRFDLFLAVVTTIIQIPPVKNSAAFPWLTVFQLARFYRVIAAVPRMESMLIRVFGSMSGLFNMILFLLLMVGLASVMAAQLFRGDIPEEYDGQTNEINFKHMWNSFLGMYQIFSSENWTTPLYSVLSVEGQYQQAVIGGLFLCAWFLFANFIVLQMFIAVIAENFGIAESQKRTQQLERYLRNLEKPQVALIARVLHQLSPYRWLRERNAAKMGQSLKDDQPETRLGAQRALDTIDEKATNRFSKYTILAPSKLQWAMAKLRRFLLLDKPVEQVPLDTIRARQFRQSFSGASMLGSRNPLLRNDSFLSPNDHSPSSGTPATPQNQETARLFARDRQLRRMRSDLGLISEEAPNQEQVNAMHANRLKDDPRIAQARLINTHPSYEKSLWLFSNTNNFRRTCQSFVPCSYGDRLFGRQTSRLRLRAYQAIIFSTIAASVIIAGVATPAYRRSWYTQHGFRRDSWFSMTEIMLSLIFIAEFVIKIVADGFAFTPNAYLLSPWNALDLFVLLTLIVNVSTEIAVIGGVSRFTRALKAFRALRLINLSDFMRRTFSALVAVSGRFIDASILAILYIVPFAIWGQNLFSGLLYSCTDTSSSILTKADCVNEYSASPSEWTFLAPRVWQNPTEGSVYSFDDFRSSLLILFEIVSLEGWTNVMATAMSVAGFDQQLQTDSRQINALFFVIYNLIGAIFVLTLFVAVIIESFQTYSGAAYLTTAQRQWIDLKRLIARQRPSKRPKMPPIGQMRKWCYDRAVHKHGWWSRSMTVLYLVSLITLATQQYSDSVGKELTRDIIYISLAVIFAMDIVVRLIGVGWRAYRSDVWNIFDLIVVSGTLLTSIPLLSPSVDNRAVIQLQKFFLVAVAFKLVQKNNALNQLFKTAVSSLPSIASLFVLWLTFFLVWGIMLVEVFGLTAWGMNETYNKNFTSLLRALVFLSMMSTGEGWNQYMHDFTTTAPYCNASANYLNTDCGSEGWAYFLFVGWNVISMYIFLNMFTATVVENFSYVFQLGGKPTLSREQVRNFKKAWAEMDVTRSGYLPKEKFVPFFKKLEGSLHVGVYPAEASITALMKKAMDAKPGRPKSFDASSHGSGSPTREGKLRLLRSPIGGKGEGNSLGQDLFMWPPSPSEITVDGLNVVSLRRQLGKLDLTEIRRRKYRFERLYTEACLLSEKPENVKKGGLPFTEVLLLLAHYKLIDDEQALSVEELVDRRELMERVEDRIETQRVRSVLRQIWLRRRFLAMREAAQIGHGVAGESADMADIPLPLLVSPPPDSSNRTAPANIPAIKIESYLAKGSDEEMGSTSRVRGRPILHLDLGHLEARPVMTSLATDASGALSDMENLQGDRKYGLDPSLLSAKDESPGHSPTRQAFTAGDELSPATSTIDLDRRPSPTIQEIDTSAWGSLARRLSSESNATGGAAESSVSSHARQPIGGGFNAFRSRLASFTVGSTTSTDTRHEGAQQPEMIQSDRGSTPSLGRRSSGHHSFNREQ